MTADIEQTIDTVLLWLGYDQSSGWPNRERENSSVDLFMPDQPISLLGG